MANVIAFDLDGTLTNERDTREDLVNTYASRTPNAEMVARLKRAFAKGWTVVIYTGRKEGMRRLTEDWLDLYGIPYHAIYFSKIYYKYLVDDRARTGQEIDRILDE